jgi:acetylcholinesterase
VSVQYRLNIFGFPNAEGLPAQNLGYYDQRLAVEWIQANIAAFGGDSKKMVLWGQSAGAGSTDAYNYAYPDDPIVTGIICDSGSAEQPNGGTDFGHTNFTSFAAHFNCSGATMLPCMRNVSATDIIDYLAEYQESGTLPAISFATIPDNVTVFSNYTERLIAGNYSKVPAIYGFNDIDGTTLIAMPAVWKSLVPSNSTLAIEATLPPPNNTAAIIEFTTSQHCPVVVTSDLRTQGGRVTYRYQYQGNFTNISPLVWMGAYHSGELPMIFGTDGDFRGPSTKFEKETSIKMQDLWLAFANDPEHGVEELGWANVTSGSVNAFGADNKTARLISAATLDAPCS